MQLITATVANCIIFDNVLPMTTGRPWSRASRDYSVRSATAGRVRRANRAGSKAATLAAATTITAATARGNATGKNAGWDTEEQRGGGERGRPIGGDTGPGERVGHRPLPTRERRVSQALGSTPETP